KSGPPDLIQFLPFTDTNYIHFSGSDAYEYRHVSEIEFILSLVDSSTLNTLLPFIELFEAFSGWYRSYRFAQNINQQYQVAVIDTTVYYDSLEIPLRRSIHGKRLEDENLETAIGSFLCKKFVITSSINYLIILPDPLPPVAIPIVTSLDTIWIAPGNWIVKDVIPSTNIDLTIVNLGEYNIPGLKREIAANVTGIKQNIYENHTFNLHQNYPNPFNPSTKLKFTIKKNGYVLLRVFDVLGREIDKIVNGNLDKGNYEFNFDASALSSGTYFYILEFSETDSEFTNREIKKMSLIK
ncbi:MAG: T9SS C-terminal target domain-containing protein, partial [Ignavibacteriales bacterium]